MVFTWTSRWKIGILISILLVYLRYILHQQCCTINAILSCGRVYDYNWAVLLVVNEGFYDFFSNWMWHYKRLGINVPIIIMSEDDVVYAKLRAEFPLNCKCNNSVYVDRSSLDSPEALRYGSDGYKQLMTARTAHILKYLEHGINVFYSDIDTVWLKNPFPYIIGSYDLWIEQVKGKIYCAGFMAMKSNAKTIKLVNDWKTGLDKSVQVSQPLFNKLLKASDVKFKPLNETLFPPGSTLNKLYVSEQNRSNVVVFRNAYVFGHYDN